MPVRLTRAEQVERNRGLVLAAARRVFLEQGYAGARLEAIAEEAGFSKGVVYSQFASKADLFLTLLERRITERAVFNSGMAAKHAGIDGLRAMLVANNRREAEDEWARLLIEFRVAAARDPEVNARYAALHTRTVELFSEAIGAILASGGLRPVYPAEILAKLILSVASGRALEAACGAAPIDVEVIADALSRLVEPA